VHTFALPKKNKHEYHYNSRLSRCIIDWDFTWSYIIRRIPDHLFTIGNLEVSGGVGINLSKFISGQKLKKGFGWFVLIMGIYIISECINSLM
jgi:hypothetical protein